MPERPAIEARWGSRSSLQAALARAKSRPVAPCAAFIAAHRRSGTCPVFIKWRFSACRGVRRARARARGMKAEHQRLAASRRNDQARQLNYIGVAGGMTTL